MVSFTLIRKADETVSNMIATLVHALAALQAIENKEANQESCEVRES